MCIRDRNYILTAEPGINDAAANPSSTTSGIEAAAPEIRGEIEFRNLTFTYPTSGSGDGRGEPVLREINLRVPAGSAVRM